MILAGGAVALGVAMAVGVGKMALDLKSASRSGPKQPWE